MNLLISLYSLIASTTFIFKPIAAVEEIFSFLSKNVRRMEGYSYWWCNYSRSHSVEAGNTFSP